ncbi:MAG: hypothetical protein EP335_09430 [Alphaproteobacteria bacterium]|nr:MAG: hypothetical protein EP335_09430 [Alphaproteobacteria bacterium]
MENTKDTDIKALVAKAEALILDEKPEAAQALIAAALQDRDHVRLWRFQRRVLLMLGDEAAAAGVMQRIIDKIHAPTPGELALAGSPRSAFTAVRKHKILYLHVPKCGSTTVKDMLYFMLTGERGEGHAHTLVAKRAPYQYLDRTKLAHSHPNWFRFLVVRDPVARLRSYYRFNLVFTNDLSKEVPGRETFLGLPLQPDYDTFLRHLDRYRQVFRTLRAHTNAITDIAGTDAGLYHWIGSVGDMAALRAKLSERAGVAIPEIHNFRSAEMAAIVPDADLEAAARERYAADYTVYGNWFAAR